MKFLEKVFSGSEAQVEQQINDFESTIEEEDAERITIDKIEIEKKG